MTTREKIDSLDIDGFKKLHEALGNYLSDTKYVKEVLFDSEPNHINLFIVRCNDLGTTNDMIYDNDWVVVTQNGNEEIPDTILILSATADPKMQRVGIANVVQQQWYGNIREHHYVFGRLAICQDNDGIWVRRYTDYKNDKWWEQYGNFTCNLHNKNGSQNSSLGCIILDSDESYKNLYLPVLKQVKSFQSKIPCSMIQEFTFNSLFENLD